MEQTTLIVSLIILALTLVTLFSTLRMNKKDKLETLYDTVIEPSSITFFRASVKFNFQKDLSNKGNEFVKKEKTRYSDYAVLLNSIKRCKPMFNRKNDFYKYLDLLHEECVNRLNDEWEHFYDEDDKTSITKTVINPLHKLYTKEKCRVYKIP